ncbi:MAG: hypothetical protein AB1656_12795 [Candidatus Omnitrophota bacterium]
MPKRESDLIDEIHEWRADLLAQCNNDLTTLGERLRRKESEHPHRIVDQMTYIKQDKISSSSDTIS